MDKKTTTDTVRILIADDHTIFRDGLRRLLESEPEFEVIGEAADGNEAVSSARRLHPDVLLLDLAMPRVPGMDALRELTSDSGNTTKIIILTAAIEKAQIVEALQIGARGIILKESATQLLLKGIRSVMDGQYWVGRESVNDIVEYLKSTAAGAQADAQAKNFGLTKREMEILGTIVAGFTNKEIAKKFNLSEDTVKHHLTNIFDKVGVSSRLELALFAINHRLAEPVS
jgi:DNA-binding NarL/FixJ family response regulator